MDLDNEANPAADDDARVEDQQGAEDQEAVDEIADGDDLEDSEQEQPEDDTDEVDHDGKKYRIPKALIPRLMKDADYTRKTQEVAQDRKALETERQTLAQQAQIQRELIKDHAKVTALSERVQAYAEADWNTWYQTDPQAAQAGWFDYQQTKDAHDAASRDLTAKEAKRLQDEQANTARAMEETNRELAASIPDWGPQKVRDIATFAQSELGLTPDELGQSDARAWKAIHRLQQAEAELKALKSKQTKAANHEKAQQSQPATRPKGNFAPAGLHDNLPADEWARRRNAQEAKRRQG
jgi:hypothetical protein